MIAIVEAARLGLLRREHWGRNIIAGLVVGVVALPLAMAFSIASGVKPEQGLYTAIIAGAAVSLFGGTRIQIAGPTGAFVVILAGVTAVHGVDGLHYADKYDGVEHLQSGDWNLDDPRDPGRSDRIYRDAGNAFVLEDPAFGRRLHLRSAGSRGRR